MFSDIESAEVATEVDKNLQVDEAFDGISANEEANIHALAKGSELVDYIEEKLPIESDKDIGTSDAAILPRIEIPEETLSALGECILDITNKPQPAFFEKGSELIQKIKNLSLQDSERIVLVQLIDSVFSSQPLSETSSRETGELLSFLFQNIQRESTDTNQNIIVAAIIKYTEWQKLIINEMRSKPSQSEHQHIDHAVAEGVKSGIEELRNALKQEIYLLRQELTK
jgi:hypothetical protein